MENVTQLRRWLVLGVMSLAIFVIFLDNTVVNTALPTMAVDLSASTSTLQWVVDAYTLVLAALLLLGGSLGDRYGRRRWMTMGLAVFGLAAVVAAVSDSAGLLIGARAFQGLGAALAMPATLSIITDVFPRETRARAIGIWTAVGGLGIGTGPAVGGWLVDTHGWASVFWLHVPVIVLALAGMLVVPESRDARRRPLDLPGAALGTAGLGALVYGIIHAGDAGWTSAGSLTAFALAVVALAAFASVERRSPSPLLPLEFFRQRDFTAAVVIIGLVFFALMVTFFFLTQYFQIVQGRSALAAGLLLLPMAGAIAVGSAVAGGLVRRLGPRVMSVAALIMAVAGMAALTRIEVGSGSLAVVGPLLLFGVGGGLGMTPLTDTVMAAVPVGDAGVGSAVNDFARELGAALGIATVGSVVNSLYRSNLEDALAGTAPDALVEAAGEGIGVAAVAAGQVPAELGGRLLAAAHPAFVDAIHVGFALSALILAVAAVASLAGLPSRMRSSQKEAEDLSAPALA
ncbi:MAG: MFS transporter [Acidimicrobiia bacterium]